MFGYQPSRDGTHTESGQYSANDLWPAERLIAPTSADPKSF